MANQGVVTNGVLDVTGTVPQIPILNIQQSQEAPFQFDPLGSGAPGIGFKAPGIALGNLAESREVAVERVSPQVLRKSAHSTNVVGQRILQLPLLSL